MKTQKRIGAFEAIEMIKNRLSKLIPVRHLDLNFRINSEGCKMMHVTVYYKLPATESNFSAHLYDFSSNMSIEELIAKCESEIATINPKKITSIEI